MFNVTILRMKDIVRYILIIIISIFLIIIMSKIFSNVKEQKEKVQDELPKEKISFGSFIGCLDKTLPTISIVENETKQEDNISNKNYLEEFLKTEISSIKGIENLESNSIELDVNNENGDNDENNTEEGIKLASTQNIKTEIVTQNPITESYNVQYENVKIKNQTSYTLTDEMLNPDITIENKNILIFHTHSCESYTSSEMYPYTPTGNYRTTDLNYTVTRVGTELSKYLQQYNFNVIHDTSYHDYPAYNGSYTRSLATVENIIKTNPADIIIDLHRDAIGSREDYAPTIKIEEDYCAQIMFVIRNK